MTDSLSRRWDATVLTYGEADELVDELEVFAVQVMNDEFTGELTDLDA